MVRSNVRSLCSSGEEAAALGRRSLLHLGQAILLMLQPPSRDETLRRALRCDPQCGAALAELVEEPRAEAVHAFQLALERTRMQPYSTALRHSHRLRTPRIHAVL